MIKLLLGGTPCQGFSRNGNGYNFDDPRSKLVFEYVKAMKVIDPDYFLLENVNMKKEWEDIITDLVGVKPIKINSGLVRAQERERTYWTNIPGVEQPEDNGVKLKEILDVYPDESLYELPEDVLRSSFPTKNGYIIRNGTKYKGYLRAQLWDGVDLAVPKSETRRGRVHSEKIGTLDTSCNWGVVDTEGLRKLSITELEKLQGLPRGYTEGVSLSQRKKMIGNGWQTDTIAHILSYINDLYINQVYSLFDGMSCGRVALKQAGVQHGIYYASEIDRYALKVSKKNYPDNVHMGDVTKIKWEEIGETK